MNAAIDEMRSVLNSLGNSFQAFRVKNLKKVDVRDMFSRKNCNGMRKQFYKTSSGGYSFGMHNTSSCHYQTTFLNKKQAIVYVYKFS